MVAQLYKYTKNQKEKNIYINKWLKNYFKKTIDLYTFNGCIVQYVNYLNKAVLENK